MIGALKCCSISKPQTRWPPRLLGSKIEAKYRTFWPPCKI